MYEIIWWARLVICCILEAPLVIIDTGCGLILYIFSLFRVGVMKAIKFVLLIINDKTTVQQICREAGRKYARELGHIAAWTFE